MRALRLRQPRSVEVSELRSDIGLALVLARILAVQAVLEGGRLGATPLRWVLLGRLRRDPRRCVAPAARLALYHHHRVQENGFDDLLFFGYVGEEEALGLDGGVAFDWWEGRKGRGGGGEGEEMKDARAECA